MRPSPVLTSLLLFLACAAPAAAGLEYKKTLVIRGRALDAEGSPLGRTRVFAEGDRRASTQTNGRGEFTLTVPLGTAGDLRQGPLRFAIAAERRGWRLTLADGPARLAAEIELEVAGGGMARCIARSNDERLAASAAKVIALDGDALASLDVDFVGVRGVSREGAGAAPKLDYVAKTTLWIGAGGSGGPPGVAEESAEPNGAAGDISAIEPRPQEPKAPSRKKAPRPSAAERALAEIRARAVRESLEAVARQAGRAAGNRQRATKATERSAKPATSRAPEPRPAPRVSSPIPGPGDTAAVGGRGSLPQLQGPAPSEASDDSLIARWRDARWRPPGADTGARAAPPAREKRGHKRAATPAKPEPPGEDRSVEAPPAEADAESSAAPSGDGTPQGSAAAPVRPAEVPPAPPTPVERGVRAPEPSPEPGRGPQIYPEPSIKGSRSRARPLVIRAERGARANESCRCRIEGTIEVQSEEPLKNPERIEVWLHWYPERRDTVELFMGSPRAFVIPDAPCGPQRLRLRALGDGQFDVVSREAVAGFRCEGGVIQRRIVLTPRRPSPVSPIPGVGEPPGR